MVRDGRRTTERGRDTRETERRKNAPTERKSHKGRTRIAHINDNAGCRWNWWGVASVFLTRPPLQTTTHPRETLSSSKGWWLLIRRLALTPRRRGWRRDPPRRLLLRLPEKPSDDGVNWATIVLPPLLFLSLRDTRARWPLAPTRPWPKGNKGCGWVSALLSWTEKSRTRRELRLMFLVTMPL